MQLILLHQISERIKTNHRNSEKEILQYLTMTTDEKKQQQQHANKCAVPVPRLYQEFESQGLQLFRTIHMKGADVATEQDATYSQFNAILKAATELVVKVDTMYDQKQQQQIQGGGGEEEDKQEQKQQQQSPTKAEAAGSTTTTTTLSSCKDGKHECRDNVEILWCACIAHICSNQIIQHIGGPEGQRLSDLTVSQLLDLVAWVELFRQTVELHIPSIASLHAKKTYFDEKPDIFTGLNVDDDGDEDDGDEINKAHVETALDVIAWANNMLWEVHRIAQNEFLLRTRHQMDDMLKRIYNSNSHDTHQTKDMRLITSLCEDVFSVLRLHLDTIQIFLNKKSDTFTMTVCLMFSQLRLKQIQFRGKFLKSLETCCAAANDFQRMGEQCERVVDDFRDHVSEDSLKLLEESCSTLVSLFTRDAVFAAQVAYKYIYEPIWDTIADELFGTTWEKELTYNELALKLTKTLDDFIADVKVFLDKFLLQKVMKALILASVIFYVECLLFRSALHKSKKDASFINSALAIERMEGDIKVLRDYFNGFVGDMPALGQVIETEFQVITAILELLRIAIGVSDSNASDFIVVLHRKVKDVKITKWVLGDLWHLVKPKKEKEIVKSIKLLTRSLVAVCPHESSSSTSENTDVQSLCLHKSLATFYDQSKRKRIVRWR